MDPEAQAHRATRQLITTFVVLIAILLGVGWLGLSRMAWMNQGMQEITEHHWSRVKLAREALALSALNSRITMQIFLIDEPAEIDLLLAQRGRNTQSITHLLDKLEAWKESAEDEALIAAIKARRAPYVEGYQRALALLIKEGQPLAARDMMAKVVTPNLIAYHQSWEDFVATESEHMDRVGADLRAAYPPARALLLLLLAVAVLLVTVLAAVVTRSTAREIWNRVLAERDLREAHDYLERRVDQRTAELGAANTALKATHATLQLEMAERKQLEGQLLQSEKLASVGQLAAGVAHEINNPVGFITSNCSTLAGYQDKLFELIRAYQLAEAHVADTSMREQLAALRKGIDLEFLQEDIPVLLRESAQGLERVRLIVQNLRDFSRVDSSSDWQYANLASAADATLELAANAIAAKADVVREYGVVEDIECLPAQINQVLMNLLQNAAQAIGSQRGCITVRTGHEGKNAWFEVGDNGEGIEAKNLNRVFEPFFTTRPVGQGTGLGLSLAYGIVRKHLGSIDVRSEPGNGTTVRVTLPLRQSPVSA